MVFRDMCLSLTLVYTMCCWRPQETTHLVMNHVEHCEDGGGLAVAGWTPSGSCTLSVHDDPAPETPPPHPLSATEDDADEPRPRPSGRYVLAAHRAGERDGLCRESRARRRPKSRTAWPGGSACRARGAGRVLPRRARRGLHGRRSPGRRRRGRGGSGEMGRDHGLFPGGRRRAAALRQGVRPWTAGRGGSQGDGPAGIRREQDREAQAPQEEN